QVVRRPPPGHLGLIQDGHRRYAQSARVSNIDGYHLGAGKAEEVLGWCAELNISTVTLWWLSTENLARDGEDVASVLAVIEQTLPQWIRGGFTRRLGIRIRAIGKLNLLRARTLETLRHAEEATKGHTRMLVNVGVGYGGRQEIVDAISGYLRDCTMRGMSLGAI